jgi:hypothetical protein
MTYKLCIEIYNLFSSTNKKNKKKLLAVMNELGGYFYNNSLTIESLDNIIDLEKNIISSKGLHKSYIEKEIFNILLRCSLRDLSHDHSETIVLDDLHIEELDETAIENCNLASTISNFAFEVFYQKTYRDNFSVKRKILSIEVLSNISIYYDYKEAQNIILSSLKDKNKNLVKAATEYQKRLGKSY